MEHKIEHMEKTPDDVRTREEAAARCTKVMKKKSAQETDKESQSGALSFKETSHGVICRRAFISLKMEQNGKKNHRSIVKVYTRIRKRQKKHRKNNQIFSDKKETSSSQWTGATQRSQLTWCCKSGQN